MKLDAQILAAVALVAALAIPVPAPAEDAESNGRARTVPQGIGLNFSGTYSSPRYLFDESYNPSWGFGGGIFVAIPGDETTGVHTTDIYYLNFTGDAARLDASTAALFGVGGEPTADLYSLHVGTVTAIPTISSSGYSVSLIAGAGIGGTSFSLDDNVFDKLGGTTLTEIAHEVDMTNLSTNRQFGIDLFVFHGVSMQYSYSFIEVDRTWKVFHSMVSSTINGIIVDGIPRFARSQLSDDMRNSLGAHVAAFAYKLGASLLWDYYTRDDGNWPYNDEPSMRYRRQAIGLTYYFPLPKKQTPQEEPRDVAAGIR